MVLKTIYWSGGKVLILDQRLLPLKERYIRCKTAEDVALAIENMAIRGAPAIGVASALGLALGARQIKAKTISDFSSRFKKLCKRFSSTRPTARNLFWAINRMEMVADKYYGKSIEEIRRVLHREALSILKEDVEANKRIGLYGKRFIKNNSRILTYCNAGALATAGYGTALGVVRASVKKGMNIHVTACETRPLLQGARLTVWELKKDRIPVTLITDNMAGALMKNGSIDMVIVGADRIARNGDVANKIGTYTLAVLAHENSIPFYVAAPVTTIDLSLKSGKEIPIEQRDPNEVTQIVGHPIAPQNINVHNPAFDITPHNYIKAIITDRGVSMPPFEQSLKSLVETIIK